MATTVNSDLIIYNDLAQTAYLERVQDNLDVFNAASQGTILLDNQLIEGDLRKRAFYKIGGSLMHRSVNSTAVVAAAKIAAAEMVGVKVPWKYGPYETTEEAFKRRARSPEEFSMLLGQDIADAEMSHYILAAFSALTGAIKSNAAMVATGMTIAADGKKALTNGMRKFGDRSERIGMFAMDSSTFFDIVDQAIVNKVYEEAGFVIYGGLPGTMGKPILVSDKVPVNSIFGLQAGAVTITESQLPGMRSYNVDNQENLAIGFRAEGAFNVDVLGYSWKETPGGANPALAALGSTANWEKYATSNKATAGVLIDLTPSGG